MKTENLRNEIEVIEKNQQKVIELKTTINEIFKKNLTGCTQ